MYLNLSGIVKLSLLNQEQRRVLISLLPSGEFFGTASLFPASRHPYCAEAHTDCTIGTIQPQTFVEIFLGVSFETYRQCTQVAMARVWRMFVHCVQGIGLDVRKRLALELLELAASFGIPDSRGTIIGARPTHEDPANSIGTSRSMITEHLAQFERQRILIREGRRLIINAGKLKQIVAKG